MSSKLNNLSELANILNDNKKLNEGVMHFFTAFKINQLLGAFETIKSKGISVSTLLISLIIYRLKGDSINGAQSNPLNFLPKIDDNTFYRLMNNSMMNWRKLLIAFAKQFIAHVKEKGDQDTCVKCFVLDDTDIEKTGKIIEFIGKIFNHVTKLYPLGYKMLLLSFWDGKNLFSIDFSLHSEKSKNGVMHILGMCKMDKRKYLIDKKELNSNQLITKYERKRGKYSKKNKSHYIPLIVDYKGITVRLFLIRYRNSEKWTILLTSDLRLSFVQAIELYQIRWSIEVLFKECKQYLRLGHSQNTDFDGQIADVTLTLITHTILTLQKRFNSYETMGELFRETQRCLLEMTLWERLIKLFVEMIIQLIEILDVDPKDIMIKLIQNNEKSQKLIAMLSVVADVKDNNAENSAITAFASAIAS